MNISYEFFPARTEQGKHNLLATLSELNATNPDFYSVTYGALGSAQDTTIDTISELNSATTVSVAPHLTCVGSDIDQMTKLLGLAFLPPTYTTSATSYEHHVPFDAWAPFYVDR